MGGRLEINILQHILSDKTVLSCEAIQSLGERNDIRTDGTLARRTLKPSADFEKEASETITSTTFQTCTSPLSDLKDKRHDYRIIN